MVTNCDCCNFPWEITNLPLNSDEWEYKKRNAGNFQKGELNDWIELWNHNCLTELLNMIKGESGVRKGVSVGCRIVARNFAEWEWSQNNKMPSDYFCHFTEGIRLRLYGAPSQFSAWEYSLSSFKYLLLRISLRQSRRTAFYWVVPQNRTNGVERIVEIEN